MFQTQLLHYQTIQRFHKLIQKLFFFENEVMDDKRSIK